MSALITPAALKQRLTRPRVRLVDATYPPDPGFHARARIDDAVIFDIDAIADQTSALPHMLPSAAEFAAAIGALGIGNDDLVVVYDQSGMAMAAARVWWMFRAFGHKDVMVLDGGLPAWHAAGYGLNSNPPAPATPQPYTARFQPALVRSAQQISDTLDDDTTLVIDARSAERFKGLMGEPRPGLRSGHIPGSINIPFADLIDPASFRLRTDHPQILAAASTAPANIVASCGSGVTACVIALALHEAGRSDTAVYDGSWTEWGQESSGWPVAR